MRGVLTACEVYSLHTRYTHSEVELRKCCLGQSAKSKIPYHLIILYIDHNHMEYLYNIQPMFDSNNILYIFEGGREYN